MEPQVNNLGIYKYFISSNQNFTVLSSHSTICSWKVTYGVSHGPTSGLLHVSHRDTRRLNYFSIKEWYAMDDLPWRPVSIFVMAYSNLLRTAERVGLPSFVIPDHWWFWLSIT